LCIQQELYFLSKLNLPLFWQRRFLLLLACALRECGGNVKESVCFVDEGRFSRLAVARYCMLSLGNTDKDYGDSFIRTTLAN
jgi:hypothetical protein